VIGTFLTWYQEHDKRIFLVATCNGVEHLPPELISRFDDKFFVNLPSLEERKSIFEIQLTKFGKDWKKNKISLIELAEASAEFTGREIEQVVKSAIFEMFYEKKVNKSKIDLEQRHIMKVLKEKVPITKTMKDQIEYLVKWVGWDEDKKNGIRANYANVTNENDDIGKMLTEILNKEDEKKAK
jgi:SpoVK/Ycf46/Vps4 family AAA+-type ATPase